MRKWIYGSIRANAASRFTHDELRIATLMSIGIDPLQGVKRMNIQVNGKSKGVQPGLTLHQLLLDLQIDPSQPGIAVALNREVVPRKQWEETEIQPESEVEIIRAVRGG
ncbi:MAG: sulfur carrier protein ThiS [Candidatus Poribacteria bacterium]|nr:sulfur carrier protein ThiS [Candidatus Poribacteria bacterium]